MSAFATLWPGFSSSRTDTCCGRRLVLGEERGFDPSYSIGGTTSMAMVRCRPCGRIFRGLADGLRPAYPIYQRRSRDGTSFNALGRVELDSRRNGPMAPCGLSCGLIPILVGRNSRRALQSSGLAYLQQYADRVRRAIRRSSIRRSSNLPASRSLCASMFDFCDAYNYNNLRGSNATTAWSPIRRPCPPAFRRLCRPRISIAAPNIASTIAATQR